MAKNLLSRTLKGIPVNEQELFFEEVFKDGTIHEITQELLDSFKPQVDDIADGNTPISDVPNVEQETYKEAISKLNTYQRKIDSFVTSSRTIGKIKNQFRDAVFSKCLFDVTARYDDMSKKITNLSQALTDGKLEICRQLLDELSSYFGENEMIEIKAADDSQLTNTINTVLEKCMQILENSNTRSSHPRAVELYYALAYFDEILDDLDFVTRDKAFRKSEHGRNMYSFSFGKANVRTKQFGKTDVAIDMDKVSSPFIKEFLSYLPLITFYNKTNTFLSTKSKYLKIGYNSFHRAIGAFTQ